MTTTARYMNVSIKVNFPDTSEIEEIAKEAVKGMVGQKVNEETKRQLIAEISLAVFEKTTYDLNIAS